MSRLQEYVFVLWGERFEEAVATIFVTELRKAGLRVRIVALTNRRVSGLNGLTLIPDLTLEAALPLVNNVHCVIVPCRASVMKHHSSDPRLLEFFRQAQSNNNTMFIIGEDPANFNLFLSPDHTTIYPDTEDLVTYVRQIARELGPL